MDIGKRFSPSLLLTIAFVLSIFLLFFIASISFKQVNTLSDTQKSITHSLDVRIDLERLFSELKDAESANRAYLLTSDERYLAPYNYSHVSINKSFQEIQRKIGRDKNRQAEFNALYAMINERFNSFRDLRIQRAQHAVKDNDFRSELWKGKLIMDRIRIQINRIIAQEDKLLKAQQAEHENEITFTPFTSSFLVIFSIAVFIATFFTLKTNLKRLSALNQRLRLTNKTFENAERIGQIAHWEYDVRHNRLSLSANRYRLIGAESGELAPNVESLLKFVHPNDRSKLRDCFDRDKNQTPLTVTYKVRRADNKIRYFSTTSQLIKTKDGNEFIIGIDKDITSQRRSTLKLEQKNNELRSTNSELSSFNHIVSHDLQEPMRKIQMFVSRIGDDDLENLSQSGRSYFLRIQSSANRAQKLIDDLLMYARLNRNDKKPEPTNLNELLENAKTDMAQAIEEKQAIILSDELPTVKATPYQIQQLFVNLISNSIKYAREDVRPEIHIRYALADGSEIPDAPRPNRKFHRIAFSDNGIGFAPEYKKRIFVLFNRLHDKDRYSGTGIGLAICKKMAESHGGHIVADGKPGKGATFTLYLPATK